jgi:hypothetical protein
MNQSLYAHMNNKRKMKKKCSFNSRKKSTVGFGGMELTCHSSNREADTGGS